MRALWQEKRIFWLYLAVTVAFWAVIAITGGKFTKGSSSTGFGLEGAFFTALLLIPLWRGRTWARSVLALFGIVYAGSLAWLLIPPDETAWGLLAALPTAQLVLLAAMPLPPARSAPAAD
jgi:hypothetical protein